MYFACNYTPRKCFCKLSDGQEYAYDFCSSDFYAYNDVKNLEYRGLGYITTINNVVQTGSFSKTLHFWKQIQKGEGQMRKHLSIEVNTVKGWGKLLRIKEQTHRGDEFGEGWNKFIFNDFRLCSAASLTDGCNVFYVRGTNESCDNNVILVPSEEWLIDCCAAVRAYNIYFGGGISDDGVEVIE